MNTKDAERIANCIAQCGILYNNMNTTPQAQALWCGLLDGIDTDEICQAFLEWCRGEKYPPTPADIRLRAKDNIEAKKKAANSVKIRGVTYHTNPPDFEKEARDRESARRWLERHRDQIPATAKPVQPTPEQIRQDRENIKQKIEQFRQQMGLSKGAE